MTRQYDSSTGDVAQGILTFIELAVLVGPPLIARLRKGMSGKTDPYLNDDIDYLLKRYSDETPIAEGVPYVEVIDLLGPTDREIQIKVLPGKFPLNRCKQGQLWRTLSDAGYQALTQSGRVAPDWDDNIIRLGSVIIEGDTCYLTIQRASYLQQARSNLILDYHPMPDAESATLRNELIRQYGGKLPPLSDRRLANTVGIACLLYYREDNRYVPYLVKRVNRVGVMPGGVHCTASGAAAWPEHVEDTFDGFFTIDMYREIEEEVGLTQSDIEDLRPVALCREFLRAGKPQVFYAGIVRLSRKQLRERRLQAAQTIERTKGWPEVQRDLFLRSTDVVIPPEELEQALNSRGVTIEGIVALRFGLRYLVDRFGAVSE